MRYETGDRIVLRDDLEEIFIFSGIISPGLYDRLSGATFDVVWDDRKNQVYYIYGEKCLLKVTEDEIDYDKSTVTKYELEEKPEETTC